MAAAKNKRKPMEIFFVGQIINKATGKRAEKRTNNKNDLPF